MTVPATSDTAVRNIVVLGSSGSIGTQTLDVCRQHPDRFRVVGLSVNSNAALLLSQAHEFGVTDVAIADESRRDDPAVAEMLQAGMKVRFGKQAVTEMALLPGADCILNALVGAAGLSASFATLSAGRRLALANKESLVVGGDLIMPLSRRGSAELVPVDSEHGAIFQCLEGESRDEVERFWVTASGGPFRGMDRAHLSSVTCSDALAHPTWKMGPKITIDSATLMNKGLEVIEAHHLFGATFDDISVVVHPQSCIHSMVAFRDGSVKAHLGVTDMRIPIQYALSYPRRLTTTLKPLDFTLLHDLTFEVPDMETFRCLPLAIAAGRTGGTAPAVMNAANEVVVAAFLAGRCSITDIDGVVEEVLARHDVERVESLEQLEQVDAQARMAAASALRARGRDAR